jgi:site-specific DNA-methyltransferase (adenine-specific)
MTEVKLTDKITVYNADCMEIMARYPDKYFDLAVVDPPYGLNMGGTLNVNSRVNYTDKKWDTERPSKKYFDELARVSRERIIWGGNYFPELWKNPCKDFIFWNKLNHHDNRSDGEFAWTSFDGLAKYFEYMWDGNRYGTKGNIRGVGEPTIRIHPTEKPTALYDWIFKNYAICPACEGRGWIWLSMGKQTDCPKCDGETPKILDTHGGSMSSVISADKNNLEMVCCELDKEYFDKAVDRFTKYKSQLKLAI